MAKFVVLILLLLQPCVGLQRHTDVVLLGATGNLAKKYLWQGFFNLFATHENQQTSFRFIGCSRNSPEDGSQQLADIADASSCRDFNKRLSDSDCAKVRTKFLNVTLYHQLSRNKHDWNRDYQKLGDLLRSFKSPVEGHRRDVVFYFSIPPSGYYDAAVYINKYCRVNGNVNFRVVLEKPFGHDENSAAKLASQLREVLNEDEILRIDHYLGKSITRQILPFRMLNPAIEKLMNKDHVERVEIFMKETLDLEGRAAFYEENGVIRDVMQNHLMELLALVAMDIPAQNRSSADIARNKLNVVSQVEPVRSPSLLLGQYSGYLGHVAREKELSSQSNYTPTFAAALLNIKSPKWDGTPFLLVSGKALQERVSYARVIFKNNLISISKINGTKDVGNRQVIFHIGHGQLIHPCIAVSKSLQDVHWPQGLKKRLEHLNVSSEIVYDLPIEELSMAHPSEKRDAYSVLIEDIYLDLKEKFVSTDHLLALWNVWSPVLEDSKLIKPRLYPSGGDRGTLNFVIKQNSLEFLKQDIEEGQLDLDPRDEDGTVRTSDRFLGRPLVSSLASRLPQLLADDIAQAAVRTLEESTSFHLALSGGSTVVPLLQSLAQHHPNLPWDLIHIWQVDERCVPAGDHASNFRILRIHLLQYVRMRHENIHRMPVDMGSKLCSPRDSGTQRYEEELRSAVPSLQLDYVVLGVGSDGHTASLFPGSQTLSGSTLVVFEFNAPPPHARRMTLTLPLINRAHRVSVLVMGESKRKLVRSLEGSHSPRDMPILGVSPGEGKMKWYIDRDAFYEDADEEVIKDEL